MQTKFIILNGPPGSGKTTIAREIARELAADQRELNVPSGNNNVIQDSFAAPMKHFIATALGEKYIDMDKEKTRPELNGVSVRRFLIDLAELHLKALYGQDIFGRWLVHRVLRWPHRKPSYCIVDDGDFEPAVLAVPNRIIVRVTRNGKDFSSDSRGYIDNWRITFPNHGDMATLWEQVKITSVILRDERSYIGA